MSKYENYKLFFLSFFLSYFLSYFSTIILNVEDLVKQSLLDYLTSEQIDDSLNLRSKWEILGYLIIPILLFLKMSIIAAVLDIGCFFFEQEIKYKKLLNIVVKAEFIFLLVTIFKTVWFYFFQPNFTLEDLQNFYPLSALNIIGYEGLQPWLIYPSQVLNLFELAYWFVLAYLIGKELNENTDKGFSIVASSYGVSLLIWVIGVMFLTLNMS